MNHVQKIHSVPSWHPTDACRPPSREIPLAPFNSLKLYPGYPSNFMRTLRRQNAVSCDCDRVCSVWDFENVSKLHKSSKRELFWPRLKEKGRARAAFPSLFTPANERPAQPVILCLTVPLNNLKKRFSESCGKATKHKTQQPRLLLLLLHLHG